MTESSSELFTQELFVQLYQGYSFKIKATMQLQQKELQQEKKTEHKESGVKKMFLNNYKAINHQRTGSWRTCNLRQIIWGKFST